MILRIFIISIIFVGTGAFAKTKIALIGDSKETQQVADLVLAKMADSNELEFLERAAIEKVLKEHNLQKSGLGSKQIPVIAKILHTDIFAVLSSAQIKKKTVPSSMRVFDACNGFCLIDTTLPPDIEKCSDFVSNKLKKLPNPKSLKFVSILAVRNAGAPAKYKRQMANFAMEVERRLIAMPDVAVLERSELGLVNKERKISKKLFKLASSAYLLDFEFVPTSSADKVDLRIYVLNASGKELTSFKFPDCLKTEPEQIIKVLAKYLKTSPPLQVADNKEEAKRFFREYKFFLETGKYCIARRKLEVAIALNLTSPDYLYELARFTGRYSDRKTVYSIEHRALTRFELIEESMKIYDEVKIRFPKYKRCLYIIHAIDSWDAYTARVTKFVLSKTRIRKVMKQLRSKAFPEMFKYRWKFELSNGINSLDEFHHVLDYKTEYCNMRWFADYEDYYDFSYKLSMEYVKETGKFLRENPQYINKYKSNIIPVFGIEHFGGREDYFAECEKRMQNCRQLIELTRKHPDKEVRNYGKTLDFYRNMALNNYDAKKFRSSLKNYFKSNGKLPMYLERYLEHKHREYKKLQRIIQEEKYEYHKGGKDNSSLHKLALRLNYEKDVEKLSELIIKNKSNIIKLRQKTFNSRLNYYTASDPRKYFMKWERILKQSKLKICRQAFAVLNHPIKIKVLKNRDDFKKRSFEIVNKIMRDNKLYLLVKYYNSGEFYGSLAIYCYTPSNNSLRKIKDISQRCLDRRQGVRIPFYVGEKIFLIGMNSEIIVIPRDNKSAFLIKDLPAMQTMSLAMLNHRVYAFLTGNETYRYAKKTILFSCLLDGSKRKIHISTVRREKQNYFDKQKPFKVEYLFADDKNKRLMCLISGKTIGGLWAFYPEKDKGVKSIPSDVSSYNIWGMRDNERLLLVNQYHNFFTYNLSSDKTIFCFYKGRDYELKWLKIKPHWHKYFPEIKAPFFIYNNILWYSGKYAGCINLNSKEKIPQCLYGINKHQIKYIRHPDERSIIAVTNNSIYKITPPEIKIKENHSVTKR